jgi:hypothetical protein
MAKVKLPLLGLEARGSLGKSIVYFPWKGINAVRQYVMPAQPRTQPQLDQRARLEAAVTEWHGASYNALDKAAWNRFAGLSATARSGFNRFVEEHVKQAILGNVWTRMHGAVMSGVSTTEFSVTVTKVAAGAIPKLWLGPSPTNLIYNREFTDTGGGTWYATPTGLTADTLYYFTIRITLPALQQSRLGIYTQRTAAV